MNGGLRIAVVVPEYRTTPAPGGGVATVADFAVDVVRRLRPTWSVDMISPRMWHLAPENRRALSPQTWIRGVTSSFSIVNGREVTYVGADWSEVEILRYRPRRVLTRLLDTYDLILVVAGSPAILGATRHARPPVVGHIATTISEERRGARASGPFFGRVRTKLTTAMAHRVETKSIKVPRVVLAMNRSLELWCRERTPRDVLLVPGGVDLSLYKPAATQPPARPYRYILSVGRLGDSRKDIPTLVEAFAHAVNRRGIPHHLVLAGNQPPPEQAFTVASNEGVSDLVHYTSNPSVPELVSLYQGADLFAMSSREEGLGMVQIEAHATGLPIVSTRTAGAEYILNGSKAGTLVDFGAELPARLGEVIATYASSDELRSNASAAALHVAERFSFEAVGRLLVETIESAVPDPVLYRGPRDGPA